MIRARITDSTPLAELEIETPGTGRTKGAKQRDRELAIATIQALAASKTELQVLSMRPGEGATTEDAAPLLDYHDGALWMGRLVGDLVHDDLELSIQPRMAKDALAEMLGVIFNVRIVHDATRLRATRSPLALLLLALVWRAAVLRALQYGPQIRRRERVHTGVELRGGFDVSTTIALRSRGVPAVASRERIREVDALPLAILDAARRRLVTLLGAETTAILGDATTKLDEWLPLAPRTRFSLEELLHEKVRTTPMHDAVLRPAIEHSRLILKNRGFGRDDARGPRSLSAVIDMAEIWELYVHRRMKELYPGYEIIHGTRGAPRHLLVNEAGTPHQRFYPDILVIDPATERVHAVVDAKYKRRAFLREDVYQLLAYQSACCADEACLVYPAELLMAASGPSVLGEYRRVERGDSRIKAIALPVRVARH